MKNPIRFIFKTLLILGICILGFSGCSPSQDDTPVVENNLEDGVLKILFIGNSHTYYNELPQLVSGILENTIDAQEVLIESSTVGGSTLKDHSESTTTLDKINKENWDFVVLQENAALASISFQDAKNEIYPFSRDLKDQIKSNNTNTTVLLYMTHAYEEGFPSCVDNPNACTYETMQTEIRRNYIYMETNLQAELAPAGIIWWMIKDQYNLEMWDADTYHPSIEGSWISALTLSTFFNPNQIELNILPNEHFDENEKQIIVETINKSIFENNPDWRAYD